MSLSNFILSIVYVLVLYICSFTRVFTFYSIHRNKDRQIEEAAEKNEEELKFYKQKVKHLQYEHQNNLTECKAEGLVSLKQANDAYTEQERALLSDKKNLKMLMREQELSHQDQINSIKMV